VAPDRPRVLFLAPRYPHPAHRGDQRRVLHLAQGLARHADVTLVCFAFGEGQARPVGGLRTRTVTAGVTDRVLANLRAPDPRLPLQARMFLSQRMRAVVTEELQGRPDVVHVTLSRLGPYLPPAGPWHRHLDLIDAVSLNMATRARSSRGPSGWPFALEAGLLARYEARCAELADSCSVVSEDDRLRGRGLARATVVPNGVDTDAFAYRSPRQRPPTLLFFGNLGYFHNAEPARFVAAEVFSRVRRELPEARLQIAGARPAPAVRALGELDGVSVLGPVASMADQLHRAAVAVVPMFSGSGIKNKVLEAFSAGTPVVANQRGILGVDGARDGEHYLGGETADELARACLELLRDGERRETLANLARALVSERYSWEHQVQRLLTLYAGGSRD
jgi:glycosyltransferase involved in cell wall biosynthesis